MRVMSSLTGSAAFRLNIWTCAGDLSSADGDQELDEVVES